MPSSPESDVRGRLPAALLVLAVGLYVSSATVADPDLWGHVRYGQDVLAGGPIVATDQYSYLTAGRSWINHEWLSEVAMAAVFNLGGARGLVALKTLLMLAVLGLLYRHLRSCGARSLAAGALVLLAAFMMQVGSHTVRPQLFSYFFFVLVMLAIHQADSGRAAALWVIPPSMALWVNFHGAFLAGLAVLIVWAGMRVQGSWTGKRSASHPLTPSPTHPLTSSPWPLVLPLLATLLATLFNPYGLRQMTFLWHALRASRTDVVEWLPLVVSSPEGLAYLTTVVLCVLAMASARRRPSPALIAVFICTAIAPLQSSRHLPMFAAAAVVIGGPYLAAAWERWLVAGTERAKGTGSFFGRTPGEAWSAEKMCLSPCQPRSQSPAAWAASILPLAGALFFSGVSIERWTRIPLDPKVAAFPARAVSVLKASGAQGNLATLFDWGQYVLWHLGPGVKVSDDGRRESLYSDEIRGINHNWAMGLGKWDVLLDRYPTDMALLDKRLPAFNLMQRKPGWCLVYEDSLAAVFAREGSPQADGLRRTPAPASLPADGAGLAFP
jgi:hypothetical protein